MKLLIVDDDIVLCQALKTYLEKFQFQVELVHNGSDAIALATSLPVEVMILDYMLPDNVDGLCVCREVKEKKPDLPILMLSARGDTADKIVGLEIGADDYLAKPFEPRELVARLKALVRRPNLLQTTVPSPSQKMRFESLEIDLFSKVAKMENNDLGLTTAEFTLLEAFAKQPGKVFNRDELSRSLKGVDWQATDRSLDIIVSKLRQKLREDLKNPSFIKTVWGTGYMFIGGKER